MSLLAKNGERQVPALTPGGRRVFEGLIGTTRDEATSIYTSRGCLVTVLGEFVRTHGGGAWTQTLIDTMAVCGVSEKATRQLLARSEERGWLHRSRSGRRTRWQLTDRFADLLEVGAERIYRHGATASDWDGRWSVALVSLPDGEGDRPLLTAGLRWHGYGALGNGVWVNPRMDAEDEAAQVIRDAGVSEPTLLRAEIGALGDDVTLAARAWPLDRLAGAYRSFADTADHSFGWTYAETDEQTVGELVGLVHQWRHFPTIDPDLPQQLLPADWPAGHANERFAAHRNALLPTATNWWVEREERYGRN